MKKVRVIEKYDRRIVSKEELIDILGKQIDAIKKSNNTYYLQITSELDTWLDEEWPCAKDVAKEITIRTEYNGN